MINTEPDGASQSLERARLEDQLSLPDPLRPYQWAGVHFLLDRESALLADEMGLGKTVQVAVALELLFLATRVCRALVVVPASLRLNWYRELTRWSPSLSVRRVEGDAGERLVHYKLPINILIASYEQIRADVLALSRTVRFGIVVLDEAQRIKNADSRTALACRMLRRDRAWALSGTPLENSASDLLSVWRFVKPNLVDASMPLAEIQAKMRNYFLRRRKREVLPELPAIIMQDLPLQLEGRQRAAYQRVWVRRREGISESLFSQAHLFAIITKLKQICNYDPESGESVKLDVLRSILDDLDPDSDKVVVFSQYVETLQWLALQLAQSVPCEVFHGGLSEEARDGMLERFRREDGLRVLLISLKAGGAGLNIQEATNVVLFDRWWNPAVEDQAIHRAHRFGRQQVLHVFRFLVTDSIEERIDEVLATKRKLFEAYVESAEVALVAPFTRQDLLHILELDQS